MASNIDNHSTSIASDPEPSLSGVSLPASRLRSVPTGGNEYIKSLLKRIPILDGTNYTHWREDILFVIQYDRLEYLLDDTESVPISLEDKADHELMLLSLIKSKVDDRHRFQLKTYTEGSKAWKSLEATYVTSATAEFAELLWKFQQMRYNSTTTMEMYVAEFESTIEAIRVHSNEFMADDKVRIQMFLNSVKHSAPEYMSFVMTISQKNT